MGTNSIELVRHSSDPTIDDAEAVLRALAQEPQAVIYDLAIHNEARPKVFDVFDAVGDYLAYCAGTPLLVCATDSILLGILHSHPLGARVSVSDTTVAALAAARRLPAIDRYTLQLDPVPEASRGARALVSQALARWELPDLVGPAWSVITELVTNAVVHAATPITASISRANHDPGTVRVAVRDGVNATPVLVPRRSPSAEGNGIWVVDQFALGWGAVHLGPGKIVWAVLAGDGALECQIPSLN